MDSIAETMMRDAAIQRVKEINDMCPWWRIEDIVETLSEEGFRQTDGTDYEETQVRCMLDRDAPGAG